MLWPVSFNLKEPYKCWAGTKQVEYLVWVLKYWSWWVAADNEERWSLSSMLTEYGVFKISPMRLMGGFALGWSYAVPGQEDQPSAVQGAKVDEVFYLAHNLGVNNHCTVGREVLNRNRDAQAFSPVLSIATGWYCAFWRRKIHPYFRMHYPHAVDDVMKELTPFACHFVHFLIFSFALLGIGRWRGSWPVQSRLCPIRVQYLNVHSFPCFCISAILHFCIFDCAVPCSRLFQSQGQGRGFDLSERFLPSWPTCRDLDTMRTKRPGCAQLSSTATGRRILQPCESTPLYSVILCVRTILKGGYGPSEQDKVVYRCLFLHCSCTAWLRLRESAHSSFPTLVISLTWSLSLIFAHVSLCLPFWMWLNIMKLNV